MSGEYKRFIRKKVASSQGIEFFERPLSKLNKRELVAAIVCLAEERKRQRGR